MISVIITAAACAKKSSTELQSAPANLAVSAGPNFNYLSQQIGTTTTQEFTITNTGATDATQFVVDASQVPGAFAATLPSNTGTIPPGGSYSFHVSFAPTTAKTSSGCIAIGYKNELGNQSASLCLSGTGMSPASLSFGSSPTSFGAVYTGNSSVLTLSLTNNGAEDAKELSASFTNANMKDIGFQGGTFPGTGGDCSSTLAPGASCAITLVYRPTTDNSINAAVTLNINYTSVGASETAYANVTGQGVVAGGADLLFGDNGVAHPSAWPTDTVIQPDGKILVLGNGSGSPSGWLVQRFNTDGSLDRSFGTNGIAIATASEQCHGPAKMFLEGTSIVIVGECIGSAIITRLDPNGNVDTTFGVNGTNAPPRLVAALSAPCYFVGATATSNGDFIVAQWCYETASSPYGFQVGVQVAAFQANGSLDADFGTQGTASVAISSQSYISINPCGLVAWNDGSLLAAIGEDPGNDFFINFTASGSLNQSFGTNGILTTNFTGSPENVSDIALQPDGKILVSGISSSAFLARMSPNGKLDATFGASGIAPAAAAAYNILALASGTILTSSPNYVQRYSSAGAVDSSLSSGKISVSGGDGLAVQQDGKILVLGLNGLSRLWP